MIENIFMFVFAVGIISFIMAVYEEWANLLSLILSGVSIAFLASAWAGTPYIIIPGVDTAYSETGLGFICFGLIIVNIIGILVSTISINVELKRQKF